MGQRVTVLHFAPTFVGILRGATLAEELLSSVYLKACGAAQCSSSAHLGIHEALKRQFETHSFPGI